MKITKKTVSHFGEPIIRREPGKLPEIVTPCRERVAWEIDALPGVTFETQAQAVEMVRHLNGA